MGRPYFSRWPKAIVSVVSQFVGHSLSGSALNRWKSDPAIGANKRDRLALATPTAVYGFGRNADGTTNFNTGTILITGAPNFWLSGGFLYDSPSNLARALFHENGHGVLGRGASSREHFAIDRQAISDLKRAGLAGGGCLAIGGFGSC